MKFGLGKKLVIFIEMSVVVVFVLCGVTALYIQYNSLVSLTKRQLTSVSVLKEEAIKRHLEHVIDELEQIVDTKKTNELFTNYLVTKDSDLKQEALLVLKDMQNESKAFSDLFVIDRAGNIVVSTDEKEEGKIRNNEKFFINGQTEIKIHDFYYNVISERPELIVTIPIINKNNSFIGIVASRVSLKEISNIMLEKSGLGDTGESFLVNSNYLAITELLKEPGAALKKSLLYLPQIENCLKGTTNFDLLPDYNGDMVFGYWSWLPQIQSCLVTKIDRSEALEPLKEITFSVLGILTVIVFLVGLFGYYFGQSIVNPLRRLRDSVFKLRTGDFSVKADTTTNDEIGEIATVFNEMVKYLSKYTEDLEVKVDARTKELNEKVTDLEQTKKAVINLLEDVEQEKGKTEDLVVERTKELKEEKARLLASINSIPFGFIIAGTDNHILLKNRIMSEMFNLQDDKDIYIEDIAKIIGKDFNLKSEVDWCIKGKSVCEIKEITFAGKILRGIVAPILRDGTIHTAIGYVLLLEDITEMKALERSRDEFFSIASHELRTPLTAIRGNTQMLQDNYKDKMIDKDMSEMIDDIHESSMRLIDIVNDFLEVSRLEQGRIVIKKEKINLTEIVSKVIKDMDGIAHQKDVKLIYVSDEKLPLVYSDEAKVEQILINLIGNALKFTTKGSVTVKPELIGNFVKISVIDTGIGISETNQSLLFRKFQQAGEHVLARDVTRGTGLGLYICRLLAGKLGITIGLEKSKIGEGSTFAFTLPVEA